MMTPDQQAAMQHCRRLLEHHKPKRRMGPAQRELLLEMLATGDPNTRSTRPLPMHFTYPPAEAGYSLLYLLAEKRDLELPRYLSSGLVKFLLRAGADPHAVGDPQGRHPLHQDLLNTHVLRRLLAAGADPNVRDAEGNTPLHATACATTAEELIACGADVNARNAAGETPLDVSCNPRVSAVLRRWGGSEGKG